MVRSKETPSDSGFTLIELLVVLSILTMVLGMSVSVFRSFGEGQSLEIAASQVSTAVRAARNWSISTGMPSRVMVDPDNRTVTAYGFSTVAAWDFEGLSGEPANTPLPQGLAVSGAFRQKAEVTGHVEAAPGSVGSGILCVNDGAALQAEWQPRYDVHRGFSVDAW
ncbi:MAG: pilus assembly FimT family protein, partial [Planctomycetota bacterium]